MKRGVSPRSLTKLGVATQIAVCESSIGSYPPVVEWIWERRDWSGTRGQELVQSSILASGHRTSRRETEAVPEGLDWDLWLGPAPVRGPSIILIFPFVWRGWGDFGCGALGDMGSYSYDTIFLSVLKNRSARER